MSLGLKKYTHQLEQELADAKFMCISANPGHLSRQL